MNTTLELKMPSRFLEACRQLRLAPTRFVVITNVAEQFVSLFEQVRSSAFRRPEQAEAGTPNDSQFVKQFQCSTSRFGIGQAKGSNCTPLGLHRIAEKIGAGEPAGLEPGFNRGGSVDSQTRFIYIHGTADQSSIGKPASCGCIHQADADLIPLFDLLPVGTLVWISEY